MKKQLVLSAILFVVTGLVAVPAHAQGARISVKVPFGFNMEGKSYPAGEYVFEALNSNVVAIAHTTATKAALALTDTASWSSTDHPAQVRFQCYQSRCFLSQVWIPGAGTGYQLHISRDEKELASKISGRYVALAGLPPTR